MALARTRPISARSALSRRTEIATPHQARIRHTQHGCGTWVAMHTHPADLFSLDYSATLRGGYRSGSVSVIAWTLGLMECATARILEFGSYDP